MGEKLARANEKGTNRQGERKRLGTRIKHNERD
jgi:hypothetical protein